MTAAALREFESGEPQLVAALQRAEQAEAHRRHAAVPIVRPEHVARHGDRLDPARAGILLDEVAGDERALQLFEELGGIVRFGRELAVEAALARTVANQRPKQRQVSDMGGLQHVRWAG